ncbi:hypothetical protein Tco_0176560 [Tanacetum coccineum]
MSFQDQMLDLADVNVVENNELPCVDKVFERVHRKKKVEKALWTPYVKQPSTTPKVQTRRSKRINMEITNIADFEPDCKEIPLEQWVDVSSLVNVFGFFKYDALRLFLLIFKIRVD